MIIFNRSTPLYGYHHTPLIRPDPESVLAGMDPARAADVMRDLSMDRTIREIVKGPGTEYAKMGMGTNISVRRRSKGLFRDGGIDVSFGPR